MMGMPSPIGEPGSGGVPCRRVPIYTMPTKRPKRSLAANLSALASAAPSRTRKTVEKAVVLDEIAHYHRGTVNLSGRILGCRRVAVGIGVYCQPILQISAQTRNFWVLEALCSAAVT